MSFAYITEEGAYIKKRGGVFVVGRNQEVVMEIPEETLEGLTLIDGVQVSSRAIVELLQLGIPVTWLSSRGAFFGRLESTQHVHVFRQAKQIELRESPFYLAMGKRCIAAKTHNQLTLLRRLNRSAESAEVARSKPDGLTLMLTSMAPIAVQPNPFAEGETVVVPRSTASVQEEPGIGMAEIRDTSSLSEVVAGLNALGVSPRDMIDILKSIHAAGALHAEFVVQ